MSNDNFKLDDDLKLQLDDLLNHEKHQSEIDFNRFNCLVSYINCLNDELTQIKGNIIWKILEKLTHFSLFMPSFIKRWGKRFLKAGWWIMTPKAIPARISYLCERHAAIDKKNDIITKCYNKFINKKKNKDLVSKSFQSWGIVSVPHTIFVAELIAEQLKRFNYNAEILQKMPTNFTHDMYIVICPQMFKKLPPFSKLISFQMEQSTSSRWFNKKYFNILKKSFAVLDYSLTNIDYLLNKGIKFSNLYYLPIGASDSYKTKNNVKKEENLLFYGDSLSCRRRQNLLKILKENFNIKIINDLFGEEMKEEITKAKLVINLHYYNDSLLETPRIQECLSLGTPVISEISKDVSDYPELNNAIKFFQVGSENEMIEVISNTLKNIDSLQSNLSKSVTNSNARFAYMFKRFLIGKRILPQSALNDVNLYIPSKSDFFVLSLPEVTKRRFYCSKIKPNKCEIFDALRYTPAWIGCASNYKLLSKYALMKGIERLTIMEDDVVLNSNFNEQYSVVNEFLDSYKGEWDIFCALIADLHPEVKILEVNTFKGMTFVTIDKMTSAVFNVYSKKGLEKLSGWSFDNVDPVTNTFDRYLENYKGLRVIVPLPYMVGHSESFDSIIWGFPSGQYSPMISNSQLKLFEKVTKFLLKSTIE